MMTPPPPALAEAAEYSDLDPAIPFAFGGKEAVAAAVDTPISCSSSPGIISLYSSSSSTGASTNEDAAALGAAR